MGTYGQVQAKPTAAYILSLLGSIIGIAASLFFIVLALTLTQGSPYDFVSNGYYIFFGLGIWCLATCVVIIYAATKLNAHPTEHSKWGAVILVFSIIGVGGLFGLIGGILALAYTPQFAVPSQQTLKPQFVPQQNLSPQLVTHVCSQCGQVTEANARFCPNCGSSTYSKPQVQPPSRPIQTSPSAPQLSGGDAAQFCGNCGTRLPPGARFCSECGQQTE
jgi:RNA polymerase subunit RPABC4/transcription elongation factor Spt4